MFVSHADNPNIKAIALGKLPHRVPLFPTVIKDAPIMPNNRFKLIAAVHLLLIRDAHVLLLRRFNTGYEDGNYSVPAGHLDGNEPVSSATTREALEEAGISINTSDLRVVHVMHRHGTTVDGGSNERVDFFSATSAWKGTPRIMEPNKCDQLAWFPIDDLPPNMIPYIQQALDCYLLGLPYSEFGWEAARV